MQDNNQHNIIEEDRWRLILESWDSKELLELLVRKAKWNNCEIICNSDIKKIRTLPNTPLSGEGIEHLFEVESEDWKKYKWKVPNCCCRHTAHALLTPHIEFRASPLTHAAHWASSRTLTRALENARRQLSFYRSQRKRLYPVEYRVVAIKMTARIKLQVMFFWKVWLRQVCL